MDAERKLALLDEIYRIYEVFLSGRVLACRKHCSHCCTDRVSLTTLEGYKVIRGLHGGRVEEVARRIRTSPDRRRFRPKITTNQLAEDYAKGIVPPEPEMEGGSGYNRCPLLAGGLCTIYPLRPFGCRCLVSMQPCLGMGHAVVDDLLLTVNIVFLQTIEQLDAGGCTGNLPDVLSALSSGESMGAYESGAMKCTDARLIANRPLRVLMIPPEHRESIRSILEKLRQLQVV